MRLVKTIFAIGMLAGVAACSVPGPGEAPDGIHDPYEAENRNVHEFNRGLDRVLLRPSSQGYVGVVPEDVQLAVSNFGDNLSVPGDVVNQILQGRLDRAARNTFRFVINTTIGVAGLVDAANEFGLPADDTDFGETLHVWGAPEGAYTELPVLGPSTQRDAAGIVVDFFLNPLDYVIPSPEKYVGTAARIASKVGDRGNFSEIVDGILYESADSYAQARLIYLQNRRFELGIEDDETYIDPYELDTEGF